MQTTRAIVFDAFGTLIRYTVRLSPYGRLLDESRRPMDRLACLTRNVPLATLAIEAGVEDEMDLMATDLAEELHGLRLFAEVPDVLAKARAAGLRLAVCSNLAHEYGSAVRGLVPDLDAYVLSYEVGVAKPHPRGRRHFVPRHEHQKRGSSRSEYSAMGRRLPLRQRRFVLRQHGCAEVQ